MSGFYKTFKIWGKSFIFLPSSMILFESNKDIEKMVKCAFEHPDEKSIPHNVKQLINIEKNTRKCLEQSKPFDDFINSIQINMINACNMRCKYCFADGGSHHKNSVMDEKQAKRVIDYVFEHIEGNLLSVVIIGGEPMLNMPVFEYILHYCKKKALEKNISVRFATTTNGTLFDVSNLQLLDSYNVMTMISQDSCDKNINDYLRCMANGRQSQYEILQRKKQLLLSQQKKRAAHITITPFNKNFAQTAISFYEEGFYHVHLDFVKSEVAEFLFAETDIAIIKEQLEILSRYIIECIDKNRIINCHLLTDDIKRIHNRIPRTRKCNVLDGLYAFSPEGNIYPCDVLMYDEYELGNIYTGMDENRLIKMREKFGKSEECANCWARYICGGKCFAEMQDSIKANQKFICIMRQYMAEITLYIYDYIQTNKPEYLDNYLK